MKNLFLASAFLGLTVAAGCSSPCDVLKDQCAKCKDAAIKNACETTANTYASVPISGNTGCQAVLDAKTYDSCN